MHNKFDLFLGYMMNPDKPVDVSTIKYIYPLTLDHEVENQRLRFRLYDKRREILLKLA